MERRYYTAATLRGRLDDFEQLYGLDSEAFLDARRRGRTPESLDPHEAFVWADTYAAWRRMRDRADPSPPPSDPEGERLADGSRPYPKSSDSALPAPSTEAA